MTEITRKGQTAGPCTCWHKIDAEIPLPIPQAGGGRPSTGRPPSRRSSRRRCRAGSLAGRGVRGVGGVMAHPAAVAAAHPAKAAAEDCRICVVCEKVLRGEGRLPSFVVTVGGIIVVAGLQHLILATATLAREPAHQQQCAANHQYISIIIIATRAEGPQIGSSLLAMIFINDYIIRASPPSVHRRVRH